MAINPNPDPVPCFDEPRHRNGKRPAAVALVRRRGGIALSGRCDPCLRTLAAAPADAVLVDVYDLPTPRVGGRFDTHDDDVSGAPV